MLSIVDLAEKIGDYQRPYLTLFKISFTPDDNKNSDSYAINQELNKLDEQITSLTHKVSLSANKIDVYAKHVALLRIDMVKAQSASSDSGITDLGESAKIARNVAAYESVLKEWEAEYARDTKSLEALLDKRTALETKAAKYDSLLKHYSSFKVMCDQVDIYSVKTVFPARKTAMQSFWWEGDQYFYSGRDDTDKQGEFTFILDQDMTLLPLLYLMKDLTGTEYGQFHAPRGNIYEGDYTQEFDFDLYQLSSDRIYTTNYCRLKGARVYEVSGIVTDKAHTGENIPLVSVKCGWDDVEWDDSRIGYPILSAEDLVVEE